jgi:hypothetical protein
MSPGSARSLGGILRRCAYQTKLVPTEFTET